MHVLHNQPVNILRIHIGNPNVKEHADATRATLMGRLLSLKRMQLQLVPRWQKYAVMTPTDDD